MSRPKNTRAVSLGQAVLLPVLLAARCAVGFIEPFDLGSVRLADQSIQMRYVKLNEEYLLDMLDLDRLLLTFRKNAGLPAPGEPFWGSWEAPEAGVRGHFIGHYLSAVSMAYASTGSERVLQRLAAMVDELERCQELLGGGYLSAFPSWHFDLLEGGQDVWVPYYVIHKLMAGLLDAYELGGIPKALNMTLRMADYHWGRTTRLIDEGGEGAWQNVMRIEFGGMSAVLFRLHRISGDPAHRQFAEMFVKPTFFGPLVQGVDMLQNLHANTYLAQVLGFVADYDVTGHEEARTAVEHFFDIVTQHHGYATGGTSRFEMWGPPSQLFDAVYTNYHAAEVQETCTQYHMLKVARALFRWTGDPRYADHYERALNNGILGSARLPPEDWPEARQDDVTAPDAHHHHHHRHRHARSLAEALLGGDHHHQLDGHDNNHGHDGLGLLQGAADQGLMRVSTVLHHRRTRSTAQRHSHHSRHHHHHHDWLHPHAHAHWRGIRAAEPAGAGGAAAGQQRVNATGKSSTVRAHRRPHSKRYLDFLAFRKPNPTWHASDKHGPGVYLYLTDMGSGVSKSDNLHHWGFPFNTFWCCYGSIVESYTKLQDSVFFKDMNPQAGSADNSTTLPPRLYLNQLVSSTLSWRELGLQLEMRADMYAPGPAANASLEVTSAERPVSFTLMARVPSWVPAGTARITLNGVPVADCPGTPTPGTYCQITRAWSGGDRVELLLPMRWWASPLPENRPGLQGKLTALLLGPFVMVGLSHGSRLLVMGQRAAGAGAAAAASPQAQSSPVPPPTAAGASQGGGSATSVTATSLQGTGGEPGGDEQQQQQQQQQHEEPPRKPQAAEATQNYGLPAGLQVYAPDTNPDELLSLQAAWDVRLYVRHDNHYMYLSKLEDGGDMMDATLRLTPAGLAAAPAAAQGPCDGRQQQQLEQQLASSGGDAQAPQPQRRQRSLLQAVRAALEASGAGEAAHGSANATLLLLPDDEGQAGSALAVRLEAMGAPNQFVAVDHDGVIVMQPGAATATGAGASAGDACMRNALWVLRPGLDGRRSTVSLEAAQRPAWYLTAAVTARAPCWNAPGQEEACGALGSEFCLSESFEARVLCRQSCGACSAAKDALSLAELRPGDKAFAAASSFLLAAPGRHAYPLGSQVLSASNRRYLMAPLSNLIDERYSTYWEMVTEG